MERRLLGVLWGLALAVLVPSVAPTQEAPPRPFLRKVIQLDDAQLASVEKGEVVTKLMPTTDKSPRGAMISTKLIGATHFFNAGLELLAAVPAADGKGRASTC